MTEIWSLCVECGPNVRTDEDGCCATCGGTAVGTWLDASQGRMTSAIESAIDKLRVQLAAMTAARDEACDIAERRGAAIDYLRRQVDGYEVIKEVAEEIEHGIVDREGRARIEGAIVQPNSADRIAELRKVGQ